MLGGWHGATPLEQMPGLCSAPHPLKKKKKPISPVKPCKEEEVEGKMEAI